MSDAYYIVVTVIFGLFILFIMWWLWRWATVRNPLFLREDQLTDREKAVLARFCAERRKARSKK